MNRIGPKVYAAALLGLLAMTAQAQQDDHSFQRREGFEEARFGSDEVTIKTRSGEKTLRVSFSQLRVADAGKAAKISLPGSGLALVQQGSGRVKVAAGRDRFEPIEGEWLRLPLPAEFSLGSDRDTVLLELITIEESGADVKK